MDCSSDRKRLCDLYADCEYLGYLRKRIDNPEPLWYNRAMSNTKHPNIIVDLTNVDGNAFSIMGAVTRAMRNHGLGSNEIDAYRAEAMSGDYNNLIRTTMNWVCVEYASSDDYDNMTDEEYEEIFADYDDDSNWH